MGFASIMEVVVTSVIFAIAAISIFSTISMLKTAQQSTVDPNSTGRLAAAYVGERVLKDLHGQLDPQLWRDNTGDLQTGVMHTNTIGGYTVNWSLTDVPGDFPAGLAPRKLMMNVYY